MKLSLALATLLLAAAPAAQAQAASPASPPQANPEAIRQARNAACMALDEAYSREMTALFPTTKNDGASVIALAVKRHSTLGRLLQIAWATGCDLAPFIAIETAKINEDYDAAQAIQNRNALTTLGK